MCYPPFKKQGSFRDEKEGDFGSRRLRVHYVSSIVLLCRRQKSHVWMMAAPPPKQAEGCRCSELPSTACNNTSKHIHTHKKIVWVILNFYIYRFVCVCVWNRVRERETFVHKVRTLDLCMWGSSTLLKWGLLSENVECSDCFGETNRK